MTARMRLRRWARAQRGRRAAARMSSRTAAARRRTPQEPSPAAERRFLRAVVCGVLFAALLLLKLVLPGNLAAFRGTLAQWLVRDADFQEAFAAVGQAVAAPERFAESLGSAYVAVFGGKEAAEVSGSAEVAEDGGPVLTAARALPDYASDARPTLAFVCAVPLDGTLTSPFGWREDPNTGAESFHTGMDLAADEGTAIACFADGTVGVVGDSTILGKYITVLHADGYETLYAHCSKISVSSGQRVARGDTLGAVGATGNATGPHLHFELHDGAKYLDPASYLSDAA